MTADPLTRLNAWDELTPEQRVEVICHASPEQFAARKLGFTNTTFHHEWYEIILNTRRSCIVAPREHAKTTVFTVNQTAWRSIYRPGTWTYVFCDTGDQAKEIKTRIDTAVGQASPRVLAEARRRSDSETVYATGSRVSVAGAGKSVRGAHPDIIIGDDILEESKTLTAYQRKKTEHWWLGTVSNMAHPGTRRVVGPNTSVQMPPTRIYLVGTPFHQSDLLMGMRKNPLYAYYRYAAEWAPGDLADPDNSLAVDIA